MSSSRAVHYLGRLKEPTPFYKGLCSRLPEAYRKFYKEWRETESAAVHFVPEEGNWKRDDVTNEVHPIQNIPIPLKFPAEYDDQIWGGEGVVQGFQKRDEYNRRVPHFWVPALQRTVVYSEVLDKHIAVTVTKRAIQLINSNYGFDHYLLKTPACDLKSLLALGLKREILMELLIGCQVYKDNPEKQTEIFSKYKAYLAAYTPEEIEWYGYSLRDACKKIREQIEAENKPKPLKTIYRSQLLKKLKAAKLAEAQDAEVDNISKPPSWVTKINPFGRKHET